MNLHVNFHSLFVKFCAACLTLAIALPVGSYGMNNPAWAASLAPATTYTVNTTLDTPDADPSNGVCADANGRCSLRAAIMDANFTAALDTILLPAGVYLLTRPGIDDNALVGDLDITNDLTIQGAGSAAALVDGNGAVTGDRVFQVLSTALNVTLSGMAIRNGSALTVNPLPPIGGGGIYMDSAGSLALSDVILENNQGGIGGGIFAHLENLGGALAMDRVIVRNNKAPSSPPTADGGGVRVLFSSSLSSFSMTDSQVYSNQADGVGGGLSFVNNVGPTGPVQASLERTQVYSNTAESGGGIYNTMPTTLSDSWLHHNKVTDQGGGIYTLATINIIRSTLEANSARYGGGLYNTGGVFPNSIAVVTNSTLSGNIAFLPGGQTGSTLGGGLYSNHAETQLIYSTVANNRVEPLFPLSGTAIGSGLYITNTSMLTIDASIIANNFRSNGILRPPLPDDCWSSSLDTTGTFSYVLFGTLANCSINGASFEVTSGLDPKLGPVNFNGGPTQTQPLLPGSPAIDVIPTFSSFCPAGVLTDQRGGLRAGGPHRGGPACDLGAYEFDAFFNLFMPFLRRGAG